MHNKRSFLLLYYNTGAHSSKGEVENHSQIHTSWPPKQCGRDPCAVICNQLSNVPFIFRHCDLLVLNKSHEKKLQVNNNSSPDCHTEGLMKSTQIVFLLTESLFFLHNLNGNHVHQWLQICELTISP